MTTYYLSTKQGQLPTVANVAEATSSPTADVILTIGSGLLANTFISRAYVIDALRAIKNYVLADDPRVGGANVLPLAV